MRGLAVWVVVEYTLLYIMWIKKWREQGALVIDGYR